MQPIRAMRSRIGALKLKTKMQMIGSGRPEVSRGGSAMFDGVCGRRNAQDIRRGSQAKRTGCGARRSWGRWCDTHARNLSTGRAATAPDWQCVSDGNACLVDPLENVSMHSAQPRSQTL